MVLTPPWQQPMDDLDPLKKVVPFRELDTDGKTKRLHERGRDLQLKKRRQEIITCIQENDHILQDVYDFIRTLGVKIGGPLKRKRNSLPSSEQRSLHDSQDNDDDMQGNFDLQSSFDSQESSTQSAPH